jgi:hypothetical protein
MPAAGGRRVIFSEVQSRAQGCGTGSQKKIKYSTGEEFRKAAAEVEI